MKRRRSNVNSDNSSTTGTNETEANTVDIFQPIPSNLFFDRPYSSTTNAYPFNTYQKYEEDDVKRPFVPSYSSATLTRIAPNHNRLWPQGNLFIIYVCFKCCLFVSSFHIIQMMFHPIWHWTRVLERELVRLMLP
jgi:hypothetical protein